jgi:glycosyltransferase involved in cell wall biosynthesis
MYSGKNVSVVIPSYNSVKTIGKCLDSIQKQVDQPYEVIVVDSSEDSTRQFIRENHPNVKVHSLAHRTFPGPARNYGATIASGEIIAFIDADCIAFPDWIKRIAERHSEGYSVVGGAIEVGNPDSHIAWAGHLGEFREFLPIGPARRILHIPTSNISYRKTLFHKHGGFPNAYYPQEDLLFNYMLNKNGVEILFDPEIRIRHFCREDLRGYLSHQHRIGRVTRCTLRRIEMPGSSIARKGWLAWVSSPALGILKYFRTLKIYQQNVDNNSYRSPIQFLLLLLGAIWWARGFASGARTGLSGIRGWNDPEEPIFARIMAVRREEPANSISKKVGR